MTRSPPSSSKSERRRLALEADEPVRVVLEHEQVALARELGEPLAPLASGSVRPLGFWKVGIV